MARWVEDDPAGFEAKTWKQVAARASKALGFVVTSQKAYYAWKHKDEPAFKPGARRVDALARLARSPDLPTEPSPVSRLSSLEGALRKLASEIDACHAKIDQLIAMWS